MLRKPQTVIRPTPVELSRMFNVCLACNTDLSRQESVLRGRHHGRYCGRCAPHNGVEVDPITLLTEEQDYCNWLDSLPIRLPQGDPNLPIRWAKQGFWSESVQCRMRVERTHYWVRYGIRSEMASYHWEEPIPSWITSYYHRCEALRPAFISSTEDLFNFVAEPFRLASLPYRRAR